MNNIIITIINNEEGLYEGNLCHYFKVIFNSSGIHNPYHNLRHYLHTTCSVYTGAKYMGYYKKYGKRNFRALLIAALFHDLGHSGKIGNDKREICCAIEKTKQHILKDDKDLLQDITNFIKSTEFPHNHSNIPSDGEALLRDADMCQNFSDVWMQQIIIGLASESELQPIELLKKQLEFLPNIKFATDWAKNEYSDDVIKEKINYAKELLEILK